jgi:hypothetical protein
MVGFEEGNVFVSPIQMGCFNNFYHLVFFLILSSCYQTTGNSKVLSENKKQSEIIDTSEFMSDSIHFGKQNETKIELCRINYSDSSIIKLKSFKKENNKWKYCGQLSIQTAAFKGMSPVIKDFNNDGFNDILLTTGTSARDANEIQTLFLFEPKTNSLIHIRNSEGFPNLDYNIELNCVNAWILTGGTKTVFLRIKNDSLFEFAEIDKRVGRIVVTIINKNGVRKEIKNIPDKGFSDFAKFKNFNPLIEH